jgi:hypothetical protein
MRTVAFIFTLLVFLGMRTIFAQNLQFKGQLSAWTNFNSANELDLWGGARYLPQLNFQVNSQRKGLVDFEASANINGTLGTLPFDTLFSNATIKPYRLWARYSTNQFELRAGLQKINFGSASMIRPLMWFDQLDPRDPLQMTDGVWGILGRYFFLSNANAWMWLLYGNKAPKTWEVGNTSLDRPELGGRLQLPVPKGELAFSYHNRKVEKSEVGGFPMIDAAQTENRFGLDGKWDLGIGLWFEASWMQKSKNIGAMTNQVAVNVGADYTFGVGNGINLVMEHLFFSFSEKPFAINDPFAFSTLSLMYPLGMDDQLSSINYYDWTNNGLYSMVTWTHQFRRFNFYCMGYINPRDYHVPLATNDINLFAGTGVQLMIVFNH